MQLTNYIGQSHLIGDHGPIKKMIDNNHLQSLILYGNPGIGKTTLANIIAENLNIFSVSLNAANSSLTQIKQIIDELGMHDKIILIIDEIHRLDTRKQNYLLPFLETDKIYLIGTTTQNPYFSVDAALRSRLLLFQLEPISKNDLIYGLYKINLNLNPNKIFSQDVYESIYQISGGDVRMATNILNFIINNYEVKEINNQLLKELFETNSIYDKNDANHYDLLSAFQKSIRASDVNAALHYLARLLKVGDYTSLLRRLSIIAYEDIGLGNPNACMRCEIAIQAFERVGMPEGRIALANTVVDLCLSPKSTSAYNALDLAFDDLKNLSNDSIPNHLVYKQPHSEDYNRDRTKRINNLPKNLKNKIYFNSQESSNYEKSLNQNYQQILKRKDKNER